MRHIKDYNKRYALHIKFSHTTKDDIQNAGRCFAASAERNLTACSFLLKAGTCSHKLFDLGDIVTEYFVLFAGNYFEFILKVINFLHAEVVCALNCTVFLSINVI